MANHLSLEKKKLIVHMMIEGNSVRGISRMTGVHIVTILRLLLRVGEYCQRLLDERVVGITPRSLELDEAWTFVHKKQRLCTDDDKVAGAVGDMYIFIGMASKSKLIISHLVGKRTEKNTTAFIRDLHSRLANKPQISTDGYKPYETAIETVFGADVDYAQIHKVYKLRQLDDGIVMKVLDRVDQRVIQGEPDKALICTSYVERQNLTLRMQIRRLMRKTIAFSKKLPNLQAAVALHVAHYNFCRVHSSIKVTPAMEAGLTDSVLPLEFLLGGEMPVSMAAA